VTAADHANTVREALDRWTTGYALQIADMKTIGNARAALDALEAQAETVGDAAAWKTEALHHQTRAEAAEAQVKELELRFKVAAFDSKLWDNIEVADTGCWEWRGYRGPHGYGQVRIGSAHLRAHRATYEAVYGPIPLNLQIDHLCRNIGCVNPAHLEAVSAKENTMRSNAITAENARKTHCKHGHEFTPENTIEDRGGRKCRTCHNEQAKQRKRRLRAEGKL
jgi:hypothetical protein